MAGTVRRRRPVEEAISPHYQEDSRRRQSVGPGQAPNRVITPARPGIPAPQITPFMTPQDEFQKIDRQSAMREAMFNIDNQLATARNDATYQTGQIDKAANFGKRDTNDAMAARGLSQSSIKDAEIFDIESTARVRKEFLQSQLSLAESQGAATKLRLQDDFTRFMEAMNRQMVANANQANANQPQWLQAPQAAVMAPHKNVVKNGKFYHVYNDGKNAGDWVYIRPASGR